MNEPTSKQACIDTPVNISLFDTTYTKYTQPTLKSISNNKVESHVQTYTHFIIHEPKSARPSD